MKELRLLFIFIFTLSISSSFAQEKKVDFRGYIKEMNILNFYPNDSLITDNFIHNRLNFHYDLSSKFSFHTEVRSRVFYGESVRLNPFYSKAIDIDPGYFDLSFIWMEHNAAFGHSIVDRVWLGYVNKNFELKVGRQRVNWGMNTVWNPNDIFNAYNFVDFDYEERPGNDAIRTQYYFTNGSKLELAFAPGRNENENIGAIMYRFNKYLYDIQVIGGVYKNDFVAGLGWAGNLAQAGFKGEASYFINREKLLDTADVLSFSTGIDYSFRGGLYMSASILYNSRGLLNLNRLPASPSLSAGDFSAKNLMITRYSGFYQVSYPVTPLFSPSLAVIYGYGVNIFFLMPGIQYSIASNWDLNLIGQLYFLESSGTLQNAYNGVFLRTKFSF